LEKGQGGPKGGKKESIAHTGRAGGEKKFGGPVWADRPGGRKFRGFPAILSKLENRLGGHSDIFSGSGAPGLGGGRTGKKNWPGRGVTRVVSSRSRKISGGGGVQAFFRKKETWGRGPGGGRRADQAPSHSTRRAQSNENSSQDKGRGAWGSPRKFPRGAGRGEKKKT